MRLRMEYVICWRWYLGGWLRRGESVESVNRGIGESLSKREEMGNRGIG